MKISKEIKTALLALTSIALLIWGYNFLKGNNIFDSSRKFYVEYDNVEGLTTASKVTVNGLIVGKINKIDIKDTGKLVVEIMMTNPVEITKNSKALIYSPSLIGGKQIAINVDYASKELAKDGDYLVGDIQNGMIEELSGKADPVMQKLDSVLYNVNKLVVSLNNTLTSEAQANIQNALAELNSTMGNAKQITTKFDKIVTDNSTKVNTIMTDFSKTSKNLETLSGNLAQSDIQSIIAKFDKAATSLNQVVANIEKGDGNVGKLLKDEQLYQNLNKASKELNMLLEDVKLNPNRYINISVFGRKQPAYSAPTN